MTNRNDQKAPTVHRMQPASQPTGGYTSSARTDLETRMLTFPHDSWTTDLLTRWLSNLPGERQRRVRNTDKHSGYSRARRLED